MVETLSPFAWATVLWKPAFFGAKPSLILKGGMIAAAAMGDPNASIPTPQPVHYRPMFGSFGKALKTSVTFVSQAALKNPAVAALGLSKPLVAVSGTRTLTKADMVHNGATPEITVDPDQTARVVIDERTGTIVIGSEVRISTVAVAHGNITVRVKEQPRVSQPLPFSNGETVTVPDTEVDVHEAGGSIETVRGASLRELVSALNRMGLKPIGIIAILQAMKTSGALQAELVVQ
mgnify:CR=1 FL=1